MKRNTMRKIFFSCLKKLALGAILVGLSSHLLAEGRAYFWCITEYQKDTGTVVYYSKQFLADISGKSRYEEAFHTYVEARHVKHRFKGGASCQSHSIKGEAKRERDESSLTKREQYEGIKVVITDWAY